MCTRKEADDLMSTRKGAYDFMCTRMGPYDLMYTRKAEFDLMFRESERRRLRVPTNDDSKNLTIYEIDFYASLRTRLALD